MTFVCHDIPDYPVMNLEMAKSALAKHHDCGPECEAKRYFAARVPLLECRAEHPPLRSHHVGRPPWNIFCTGD
ncbi:hypothetical protein [Nocardia sp. CDC160]|uniref:hypothetical protein n=1 Tax=Nocardia sp. CDC160 TaxID=3112166 RepID=UPI002DB74188|nr:hypothetical protein [Nocardia sp. CDC160]MEC3918842.1 hypothetical protein [Nocardia sp. CDC160]